MKQVLKAADLAALLEISKPALAMRLARGQLPPGRRVGATRFWLAEEIMAWLSQPQQPQKPHSEAPEVLEPCRRRGRPRSALAGPKN